MKRLPGFTLIELLIVIVILSFIVALSTPRFSSTFRGMKLTCEANRALSYFQFVKNKAVNDKTSYKVYFDKNALQWKLAGQEGIKFGILQMDSSLKIDFAEESIFFYPNGTVSLFTVTAEDASGNRYQIFSRDKSNLIEILKME